VVSGTLLPGLGPESPEVRELLAGWQGSYAIRAGPFGYEMLLFQAPARRERWWLHILLFAATLFSTVIAGSLLSGYYPVRYYGLQLVDG
jgi:hypothetical protein